MSLPALDARTIDRLAALAGMFGSNFAGERANAAAMATTLLRAHGVTWRQLVEAAFRDRPPVDDDDDDALDLPTRAELAEALLSGRLSTWELGFLRSILELEPRDLSDKQKRIVAQIMQKAARP